MFENFKKGFGFTIGMTAGMYAIAAVKVVIGVYFKAGEKKEAEKKDN